MRIGILASPTIRLSSIFFYDYHQLFSELSKLHEIYLVGSLLTGPKYAQKTLCLPLLASRKNINLFGLLGYIRKYKYLKLISHNINMAFYLRKALESKFDSIVASRSATFFAKNNVEIVYSFPFYPDFYLAKVAKMLKRPLLLEFWEDQICFNYEYNLFEGLPIKEALKERKRGYCWLKRVSMLADHIIVPSKVLKNRMKKLGIKGSKISIIPVCTHPFLPKDPSYIKRLHGLHRKKIVYYIGSMSPWHDLKCLITAVGKSKCKEVVLIISGGSKHRFEKLRGYIKGIDKPVIYTGKVSPIEADYYISSADICIAPYKLTYPSGFFPGAVVRYMLAGKSIIATDLPEIREMFRGQKAGILVSQGDSDSMAEAIDFLIENPEEGKEMGHIAKEIAENNYLWHHHVKMLENVLKHLSSQVP